MKNPKLAISPHPANTFCRKIILQRVHSFIVNRPRLPAYVVAWLVFLTAAAVTAATRVGVATVDITPPLGIPLAGYYHARGADSVLDPLLSKAMVIEQGGERVALVVLDIISVTRSLTDQARADIEKATGLRGASVMISATHAHTGPELAQRGKRSDEMGGQSQLAVEYTRRLPELIAESVRLANERLQPASLSRARGRCEHLAYNRRYYMRDGTVGWNPGKLNPNIVMPAGPTDPEVGILLAEIPNATGPGQSIATYVNFAMHPDTTGGSKISADWPGALSRVMSGYHGTNHVTLVANGTCGNLNNFDFFWKWPNSGPFEQNRIAAILGATVFQAYKELQPLPEGSLRARSGIVELPLPEITAQQVEAAKQILANTKDDRGANFMNLVRAYRTLNIESLGGRPHRAEVQVIALGKEVAWVGLPGEVFVELGLAIKKRSPFPQTLVIELANDNLGYIPDRRSYAEGNYEPESSRCAAGSGEKLVDNAVRLLTELFP
jgi:neutral ceramidase